MKQNNNKDTALQRTVQWVTTHCLPQLSKGMLFAIGFFGTTILAVAISGTVKTWTTGEVLKSADLNTTISSLKTAIEGITSSQWVTSGSSVSYTAGNVGIGTNNPSFKLDVQNSSSPVAIFGNTNGGGAGTESTLYFGNSTYAVAIGAYQTVSTPNPFNMAFIIKTPNVGDVGNSTLTERFRIASGGNIGIGTTSPDQLLSVNGNASKTGGTAWAVFSDIRLKDSINPYKIGLKEVLQINPITYRYKKNNSLDLKGSEKEVGISAQELQKIIPDSVKMSSKNYLQFHMDYVSWAMLNSIKEVALRLRSQELVTDLQQTEKAANDKKVIALEEENTKLRERLSKLENSMQEVIAAQKISRETMAAQAKK